MWCSTVGCIVALTLSMLAAPLAAEAQQAGKIYRIGFLRAAAPPESYIEAFRQGLKALGYIEGKNIALEYRWAGGKTDQLPELATELVRLKVDIIVTDGGIAALPAKQAASGDPVGTGLVASLARPGGNITGLTSINPELGGKLLDLLKEIVPRLARVAIALSDTPTSKLFLKGTEVPARGLRIELIPLMLRGPDDFESAFRAATKERADALLVRGTPRTSAAHRKQIVELAAKSRLPAIYDTRDWVDAGGLMSYGADRVDMYRRAATYVDKILKGAKPADLPVEQPIKFDLVINLKTAKELGLTLPSTLLFQADEVLQ